VNYADYSAPKSPYAQAANPQSTYLIPTQKPDKDSKEGTFGELKVTTDGVGEFRINHFIAFSEKVDSPVGTEQLAAAHTAVLHDEFPFLFSLRNSAKASWGRFLFEGQRTVEFELGGDAGANSDKIMGWAHSDWVAMQVHAKSKSFFARTLKRKWCLTAEKLLNPFEREISQRHVLAGRRSWKVGFDINLHRYFIETCALERNSSLPAAVFDLQSSIPRELVVTLWRNLIENFTYFEGPQHIDWTEPRLLTADVLETCPDYLERGDVLYRVGSESTLQAALDASWFKPVMARHPGLTEGVI
jgi:hypothetical protein